MLASQLGVLTGIDIQQVSLKRIPKALADIFREDYGTYLPDHWKPVGALIRNVFLKNHDMLYGMDIIGTASDPVTLEQVEENIRRRYLDSEDLLQAFSDMIIFDAWIGNMDRHHENWGILQKDVTIQFGLFNLTKEERERIKKSRRFSSLFDHGSSLLFELSDDDVDKYLNDPNLFVSKYILGKRYILLLSSDGSENNVYTIIKQHIDLNTEWSKRFKKSITKIQAANSLSVARLILQMPTDGLLAYSQNRKSLLYKSLEERRNILSEYIR